MIKIKNDILEVQINQVGAEVRSVINISNNHEYMWSGDSKFWSGISPVLFPVVGKSTDGKIRYQGKEYSISSHGFAKSTLFDIVEKTEDSVLLAIESTSDNYPFALRLEILYKLEDNKLITDFNIINLSEVVASCGFGAHPAFACPFDDKHQFSDYSICFDKQELSFHKISDDVFYTGEKDIHNISEIKLHNKLFDNDALIYSDFSSKEVTLVEKGSNRFIRVIFDGFEYLGIWSKPKMSAPYVCIEPWCGKADMLNYRGDIDGREANISILPADSFMCSYTIEFGY